MKDKFRCMHLPKNIGPPTGGQLGNFTPGSHRERGPRRPHQGPFEYLFKRLLYSNRAVRSDTLIEQSQYSSEEQCSKLINKEIWLLRSSYCHCQHVMTFCFWSSTYSLGEVVIQNGNLGPHFNCLPWAP